VEQRKVDQTPQASAREPGQVGIAEIRAVNVVYRVRDGYFHDTAIDKRPVDGPVQVTRLGLAGDRQLGSSHGGVDKAVYAYSEEDADWWAAELGREIPPGLFGENLRTHGLATSGAVIGEQWSAGTALFEVRMPRTPCENLSLRMGLEGFHIRFNSTGRVGALLRVLQPGVVRAGDILSVVDRPDHGVRVADLATGPDAAQMQRLLDSGIPLAKNVRAKALRVVRRAGTTHRP
jgi:MOSC domain-containing protein YiiM